jgi:hypothetical protein
MIAKSELIQNRRDLRLTFHEAWTCCLYAAYLHYSLSGLQQHPGCLFSFGDTGSSFQGVGSDCCKSSSRHVRSLNKKAENSKSFVKFKWKTKALHQIKQPHEAAEIPLTKSSDTVTPSSFKEQVVNMSTELTWISCPC